ncbi:MAG: site-specific tyrosine recombinase/integron integrase [Mangrovibacterium sp.]
MSWNTSKKKFEEYLRLERALSPNSISAYLSDISKFIQFMNLEYPNLNAEKVNHDHLQHFLEHLNESGSSIRTQARTLSGIKSFFNLLKVEELLKVNPATDITIRNVERNVPEILTIAEIDALIAAVNLKSAEGERNVAMLETLYSCGLRVSELINLKITDLFFNQGFIEVSGKGEKKRLVPISDVCKNKITAYIQNSRKHIKIKPSYQNYLFLNRRGSSLSRVMIFTIVKGLAEQIGLKKSVSPHTFRHSFATHLIAGGADLRVVQDMLGHESILTTEIYLQIDPQQLKESVSLYHPQS